MVRGTAFGRSRCRVLWNSWNPEAELTTEDTIAYRLRRNVKIDRRRTSVSLESHLWQGLLDVCERETIGIDALCTEVDRRRRRSSMSSSLRVFLLLYFRGLAEVLERRDPTARQDDGSGFLTAALDSFRAAEAAGESA